MERRPPTIQAQCQTRALTFKCLHSAHTVYLLGVVWCSQINSYYIPKRMNWLVFAVEKPCFSCSAVLNF